MEHCKRITHANSPAHGSSILWRGLVRAMISMCFAIAWLVELESLLCVQPWAWRALVSGCCVVVLSLGLGRIHPRISKS